MFRYLVTSFIVIFIMPSCTALLTVLGKSYPYVSIKCFQINEKKLEKNGFVVSDMNRMKNTSKGFRIIHLLRAFWKWLFWKWSASKFYQLLKRICKNIHRKAPPYCCYWNVLQSFSYFDNSNKWIVAEVVIQRYSLELVILGPRKITFNFSKIRDK